MKLKPNCKNQNITIDVAFGLWSLARSWRTFPGARLSNDQGLEAASEFVVL
jgi:hypothetical protein